jgi:hypothetical protein
LSGFAGAVKSLVIRTPFCCDPEMVIQLPKFKLGHCQNQIRSLGVETGQRRTGGTGPL